MSGFEEELDALVAKWRSRLGSEETISTLELMIYRLKEEVAGDDE